MQCSFMDKKLIIWRILPQDEFSSQLTEMKKEAIIHEFQPEIKLIWKMKQVFTLRIKCEKK